MSETPTPPAPPSALDKLLREARVRMPQATWREHHDAAWLELSALRAEIDAWHTFAARLAEHLHGWDKSFPVPSEPDEQASYRCSLLVRADVVCAKHARMSHALERLRDGPWSLDDVRDIAREALGQ